MKVAFVCMGAENLGVEYLSAVLEKEGHRTELFFDPALFDDKLVGVSMPFLNKAFSKKKKILKGIISSKPDFIAFSVMTDTYKWACDLAIALKGRIDVPIIFGGIHPTSVPDEVIKNDFVDYVVVGEGEYALLDIVDGRSNRPNIWRKDKKKIVKNDVRPLIADLDSLPFPNKRIFEKYISTSVYVIMTSRDCPFNCTYCCNSIFHKLYGSVNRRRSVANVMEELRFAKARYELKNIKFVDDLFTSNKEWLIEFLEIYKREVGIPFTCNAHPFFMSDEVAKALEDAGSEYVEIGIQTFNEDIKRKVLNRRETNVDVEKALNICAKYGLKMVLDYIVGFPGETEQDLVDACKFFVRHKPLRFNFFYLSYFPRTEIIKFSDLTDDEIAAGEKGIAPMYLLGGRTRGSIARNFEVMLKLIPLLPNGILRFILDRKLYKMLAFLRLSLLINILTLLKTREARGLIYLRECIKNIFR